MIIYTCIKDNDLLRGPESNGRDGISVFSVLHHHHRRKDDIKGNGNDEPEVFQSQSRRREVSSSSLRVPSHGDLFLGHDPCLLCLSAHEVGQSVCLCQRWLLQGLRELLPTSSDELRSERFEFVQLPVDYPFLSVGLPGSRSAVKENKRCTEMRQCLVG